jgi:alanine dehydrogenase
MIHIAEEQVREILSVNKAVELLENCFGRLGANQAVNHPRRRIKMHNQNLLHYMAAGDNESGYFGAKIYATSTTASARFLVTLFDAETVSPVATIDADALGQIRTGAASGVATKFMANPGSQTLGVIGTGWQAETQLAAVACVRTLRRIKVYSRSEESRDAFAEKMSVQLGINIESMATAEDTVRDSDIVTTITNSSTPVFEGSWLQAGVHVNAAGSNSAKRREVDGATITAATLIAADSVEQAKMEAGDLVQAHEEGLLEWERVQELSTVVRGVIPGRNSPDAITLFESQGLALEDIAVAGYVYEQVHQA